jgi:hypothetical protein
MPTAVNTATHAGTTANQLRQTEMNAVRRDLLGTDPVEELTTDGTVLTVPLEGRENEKGIRVLLRCGSGDRTAPRGTGDDASRAGQTPVRP